MTAAWSPGYNVMPQGFPLKVSCDVTVLVVVSTVFSAELSRYIAINVVGGRKTRPVIHGVLLSPVISMSMSGI